MESASSFPGLVAVKLLCKKPGLKDNNFQVLGAKVVAVAIIAKKIRWTQKVEDYQGLIDRSIDWLINWLTDWLIGWLLD